MSRLLCNGAGITLNDAAKRPLRRSSREPLSREETQAFALAYQLRFAAGSLPRRRNRRCVWKNRSPPAPFRICSCYVVASGVLFNSYVFARTQPPPSTTSMVLTRRNEFLSFVTQTTQTQGGLSPSPPSHSSPAFDNERRCFATNPLLYSTLPSVRKPTKRFRRTRQKK